ncbi:50S ribosomal protein L14e [Candidatus Woesearchaeota archaeon]|nr:50S ribosomal protein L14e [Candidatus Woesearchaeota archaeon]
MFDVGRVVIKIAGRDARKKAVIIDVLEDNYVLIDGETRRRKCNIKHLEPIDKILKISKKASHKKVKEIFSKELGITLSDKKNKKKTSEEKKSEN